MYLAMMNRMIANATSSAMNVPSGIRKFLLSASVVVPADMVSP